MFGLFKKDPLAALQQKYNKTLEAAMLAQRNGNLRGYAELTEQAEALGKQLDQLAEAKKPS